MVSVSEAELRQADPPISEEEKRSFATMIGTVAQGTNIRQLNLEIFGRSAVAAGRLLRITVSGQTIYYQVFEGKIQEETAVSDSTRAFVQGEAEQVGNWSTSQGGFETHDWVPLERSAVFLVNEDEPVPPYELQRSEISIGRVPSSNFNVHVDLNDLILCHTAILGVTGTGKSFLAYKIIEETARKQVKVVCVDPTGDYQRHLANAVLLDRKGSLEAFLGSPHHFIGILETGTLNISPIEQSRLAASVCLQWCRDNRQDEDILNPSPKILMVFEEAHLLVPEWNFNPEKKLQEEVSKTSQIVLQARKYGLGFLVVTQRTANVVKSVLNQCNTIASFQAFDETSFEFLRNYMGAFHVHSLPTLRPRHGIVVGKASKSKRPIMVMFDTQDRTIQANPAGSMPLPPPETRQADGAPLVVSIPEGMGEDRE